MGNLYSKTFGLINGLFRKKIKKLYRTLISNQEGEIDKAGQTYWKNKFFCHITLFIFTFGIPLILFGSYRFVMAGDYVQAGVEILLFASLLLILISKRIKADWKKLTTVILLYVLSILILTRAGISGAGLVFVLFTMILAGCLLEKKQIIYLISINLVVFFLLTLLLFSGYFEGKAFNGFSDVWFIDALTTQAFGIALIMLINNIFSGLERQAKKLQASREKYKLITENTSDVISVFNVDQEKFTYVSPSSLNLTGFTAEESIHQKLEQIVTGDSYRLIQEKLSETVKSFIMNPAGNNAYVVDLQQLCKSGNLVWVELSARLRYHGNKEIEIVCITRNIDARKQAEQNLLHLSYYDHVTDLYNRRYYEEELKRLDVVRNYPLALIMLDVNGLKITNEAFGHAAGDQLLKNLGDLLKKECRADEIIARIGGDEFIILITNTDLAGGKNLMGRLNEAIEKEKISNSMLSVSMGLGIKKYAEIKIEDVFKMAEDEMHRHKISESASMRSKSIDLIMNSLYAKSQREMFHSKRVGELSHAMGIKLNWASYDIKQLYAAGIMHDIGKIGVSDKILNKFESLDQNEWEEIKRHPEMGYRILNAINEFSEIAQYVLEHQERWDGKGYPRGLKGTEISIEARIIAISDAYDAMTSDRTYRKGMTKEEAFKEIRRCTGNQFDPDLAEVFCQVVQETKGL